RPDIVFFVGAARPLSPGREHRAETPMDVQLPAGWRKVLSRELEKPYFQELMEFVDHERRKFTVYPPEREVFKAFQLTPYADVKVLLLGQDPYHGEGQAHG